MQSMYKLCLNIFLTLIIISCSNQNISNYPETKKEEFTETIHGYEISDSYRWLEDFTSDDSLDWVKRQNKFTKTFISKNNYKKDIANYLEQIWENESISIPYKEEGKTFYYFNDGSFQQSKLMIKDCDKCDERVLIDPNTFSDDGTISLGGTSVNNSAELLTLVPPKDMVPSSEKVFGSIKTRSSHLSQSLIINLLCWKDPSLK